MKLDNFMYVKMLKSLAKILISEWSPKACFYLAKLQLYIAFQSKALNRKGSA